MITPEMSRALGRFIMAVDRVRENEGIPYTFGPPEDDQSRRFANYVQFIVGIHEKWAAIECSSQAELDIQQEEIYRELIEYPDQELVEKAFDMMKRWPEWLDWLGEEEQALLHIS